MAGVSRGLIPCNSIPEEILLSEPVPDMDMLSAAFSEQAGRRVAIRARVRGDRARWVQMALSNADMAVTRKLADRSNVSERLEALQEALNLHEPPARIECFDVSHTAGEATVASCVVFDLSLAVFESEVV